jgi:hypothetical protein
MWKTSERRINQNPRNKNFLKSNKKYGESYSSRLEQVEDRISGLEDKMHPHTGNQCESTPCIAILISTSKNPCSFLLLLILSLQQN